MLGRAACHDDGRVFRPGDAACRPLVTHGQVPGQRVGSDQHGGQLAGGGQPGCRTERPTLSPQHGGLRLLHLGQPGHLGPADQWAFALPACVAILSADFAAGVLGSLAREDTGKNRSQHDHRILPPLWQAAAAIGSGNMLCQACCRVGQHPKIGPDRCDSAGGTPTSARPTSRLEPKSVPPHMAPAPRRRPARRTRTAPKGLRVDAGDVRAVGVCNTF